MRYPTPPRASRNPLEVTRDGHLIYSFGYSGSGPLLECIELLGPNLEGASVRTTEVDRTCSLLLVFSKVRCVETDRITPGALQVLEEAGIELLTGNVEGTDSGEVTAPVTDLRGFYDNLRVSRRRLELGWIT